MGSTPSAAPADGEFAASLRKHTGAARVATDGRSTGRCQGITRDLAEDEHLRAYPAGERHLERELVAGPPGSVTTKPPGWRVSIPTTAPGYARTASSTSGAGARAPASVTTYGRPSGL